MEEERILVIKKDLHPCIGCHKEEDCLIKCSSVFEWENSISRQEAIERIAKAICSKCGISSCKSCALKGDGSMCQDFIDGKKSLAEAALNALLEGE